MSRPIYLGRWRIDLTVRDGTRVPLAGTTLALAIARAADAAGAPSPGSIGLILSDDRELATLNVQHLGTTGATDVLSFPLQPPDAFPPHPGSPVHSAGTRMPFPLPPGRRPHLGDIVVSVERATDQARDGRGGQTGDVRWSVADELRLLVTHGTLHLCGWDHADPVEEAAMRALENQLLMREG